MVNLQEGGAQQQQMSTPCDVIDLTDSTGGSIKQELYEGDQKTRQNSFRRLVRHPQATRHQQHVGQMQPARLDPQAPSREPSAAAPQPSIAREAQSPAGSGPVESRQELLDRHADERHHRHQPRHLPSFVFLNPLNSERNVACAPDGPDVPVMPPPMTTGTSQPCDLGTPQRLPSEHPMPCQRPSSSGQAGLPKKRSAEAAGLGVSEPAAKVPGRPQSAGLNGQQPTPQEDAARTKLMSHDRPAEMSRLHPDADPNKRQASKTQLGDEHQAGQQQGPGSATKSLKNRPAGSQKSSKPPDPPADRLSWPAWPPGKYQYYPGCSQPAAGSSPDGQSRPSFPQRAAPKKQQPDPAVRSFLPGSSGEARQTALKRLNRKQQVIFAILELEPQVDFTMDRIDPKLASLGLDTLKGNHDNIINTHLTGTAAADHSKPYVGVLDKTCHGGPRNWNEKGRQMLESEWFSSWYWDLTQYVVEDNADETK